MQVTDYLRRLFRRRTVCGRTRAATFEPVTAFKPMTLVIGRIYKIDAATEIWRWGISLPLNSCEIYGDGPTREDAMAAFRAEYERWIEDRPKKPDRCQPSRPNWQERPARNAVASGKVELACKGTSADLTNGSLKGSLSTGLIIDFTAGAVHSISGTMRITSISDTQIEFSRPHDITNPDDMFAYGNIDRMTGETSVEVTGYPSSLAARASRFSAGQLRARSD